MHEYAVILGHQPHITLAELAACVPGFSLISIEHKVVALFSASEALDPASLSHLGGSSLIAQRITESDVTMDDVPQLMTKEAANVKKKVTFSLRCFGIPKQEISKAYRTGKDLLKKQGKPCRYIGNERKPAATALLLDSEVANGKKGVEIVVMQREHELWVGKTIFVQDINAYTWRDMEKPVRDTTVGLLPPKLAQILLNFGAWMVREGLPEDVKKKDAQRKRKKKEIYTVLDPFCGTGVIPIECLLRGWHVEASDVSQKAVNGTKKNLEWVRKERKILKKDVAETVAKHNALKPFGFKQLPDMVVTETTLGPNLTKKPTKTDAKKHRKENETLQLDFLRNAAETLPNVPIACTWPFWRVGNETIHLEKIWDALSDIGYEAVLPEGVTPDDPKKPSLRYQRKDQFVGREIVLLKPIEKEVDNG